MATLVAGLGAFVITGGEATFTVSSANFAKLETLSDAFDTLDAAKWTQTESTATDIEVADGVLRIKAYTSYPNLRSVDTYDLTDSYLLARLIDAGTTQLVAGRETYLRVESADDATDQHGIVITGDLQKAAFVSVDGVKTFGDFSAWTADSDGWLRIRESGGTVYYETSSNGRTWTVFDTFPTEAWAGTVKAVIEAGNYTADEVPDVVVLWDNVNRPPSARDGDGAGGERGRRRRRTGYRVHKWQIEDTPLEEAAEEIAEELAEVPAERAVEFIEANADILTLLGVPTAPMIDRIEAASTKALPRVADVEMARIRAIIEDYLDEEEAIAMLLAS